MTPLEEEEYQRNLREIKRKNKYAYAMGILGILGIIFGLLFGPLLVIILGVVLIVGALFIKK